jgi:hypothetical protein
VCAAGLLHGRLRLIGTIIDHVYVDKRPVTDGRAGCHGGAEQPCESRLAERGTSRLPNEHATTKVPPAEAAYEDR